jgi:NTP pyrophosphatase (non-canonical NTP hydrolase)
METDITIRIYELKEKVKNFCEVREWAQFHDAKELAIALSIEASELLEHFRWKSKEEVNNGFKIPEKREEIEDELSDIFYFVLRIAQLYDIDLSKALDRKMKKNEEKYPVEKSKGNHKKYTEF